MPENNVLATPSQTVGDNTRLGNPLEVPIIVADSGGYGNLVETPDPINGGTMWVPVEMATEVLLGTAQGIDFNDPKAIERYRASSGCVAREMLIQVVGAGAIGAVQEESLKVSEEFASLNGYKRASAYLGVIRTGAGAAGVLGGLIDFNNSILTSQSRCVK